MTVTGLPVASLDAVMVMTTRIGARVEAPLGDDDAIIGDMDNRLGQVRHLNHPMIN